MDKFECSMCGKCCTHIDELIMSLPSLARIIGSENAVFPYSHLDGRCQNLNKDNTCLVYTHRPVICDVEKMCHILAEKMGDYEKIKKLFLQDFKKECLKLQNIENECI